ncbi:MAG TPA: DUF2269 family protein [Candidatus Limnocylindria bacterium]
MEWFPWFLFLHVLAAIIAFGPTFSFAIIGAMGGAEPQHANFATRVSHRISDILVTPFAISMPVTGALMIWAAQIPLLERDARWLLLAILLYAIALSLALFVSRPNVNRIIAMSGGSGGAPAGAQAGGPAGPPAGPPPEMLRAIGVVQRSGMALVGLVVVIVFLMVMRPDLGF